MSLLAFNAYNQSFSFHSYNKSSSSKKSTSKYYPGLDINGPHFLDSSNQFQIHPCIINAEKTPENLPKDFIVTLATQSTLSRLEGLKEITKYWSGPMSISIFTPSIEFQLVDAYLRHLYTCHDDINLGDRITVNIFYPLERPPIITNDTSDKYEVDCSVTPDTNEFLATLLLDEALNDPNYLKWRTEYPYPQNIGRNIARKSIETEYMFLVDSDIIPSLNSAETLTRFLSINKHCEQLAFVVPVYELDEKLSYPEDKKALMQAVSAQKARPFHVKIFPPNSRATNYARYENDHQNDYTNLHVSHVYEV